MKNTVTQQKQVSILIRIPEQDKIEAVQILNELGITLTQSFYMFVKALISKRGVPFPLNVNDGI
jgi:addiction module RelB/DinJ family antitoxin